MALKFAKLPEGAYNLTYVKTLEEAGREIAFYGTQGFTVLIQDTDPSDTGDFFIGRYALNFFGAREDFLKLSGLQERSGALVNVLTGKTVRKAAWNNGGVIGPDPESIYS